MRNRLTLLAAAAGSLLLSNVTGWSAPNIPSYIAAAVADSHRPQADTVRDVNALPAAVLAFTGVKPGDTVIELSPGSGYMTRILSMIAGPSGHLYAMHAIGLNAASMAKIKPIADDPVYANVTVFQQDLTKMKTPQAADIAFTWMDYHDFQNPGMFATDTAAMDKAIFAALKPGGRYVVVDYVAPAGSGLHDSAKLHRSDEEAVKAEVLAAGFIFDGESDALRNRDDDHSKPISNENYTADSMVLKFRKP